MMVRKLKEVTVSLELFYQRIAWLELEGMQEAADAVRGIAAFCTPVFRVDETQSAAFKKKLQDYRDATPLLD